MELRDTVEGMLSDDYRERFKAEYRQAVIRRDKLAKMLNDYSHGRLDFKLKKSSYSILTWQLDVLIEYVDVLEQRAIQEGIKIKEISDLRTSGDMNDLSERLKKSARLSEDARAHSKELERIYKGDKKAKLLN